MADEITEFQEKLGAEVANRRLGSKSPDGTVAQSPSTSSPDSADTVQWSVLGNGRFMASSASIENLAAGVYGLEQDNYGRILFVRKTVITDELIVLPDTASERVLTSIQTFWESKPRFIAKKQIFKRGVMLWGPAGSGKTSTLMLLSRDIIERDGIVILPAHPVLTTRALDEVRRIEPERPLICVLEDIDEMVDEHGEHAILALLDGETQIDNVVYVATTNYPERLDRRLVNRPSRFDEVIKVDMPTAEARGVYLRARCNRMELPDDKMSEWVKDSEGFSVAHLRELIVAVFCLGREYKETVQRLRSMSTTPKSSDRNKIGMVA